MRPSFWFGVFRSWGLATFLGIGKIFLFFDRFCWNSNMLFDGLQRFFHLALWRCEIGNEVKFIFMNNLLRKLKQRRKRKSLD